MTDFLAFLALLFLMRIIFKFSQELRQKKTVIMVDCPPHKWEYKNQPGSEDVYLVCSRCKMLPGGDLYEEEHEERD